MSTELHFETLSRPDPFLQEPHLGFYPPDGVEQLKPRLVFRVASTAFLLASCGPSPTTVLVLPTQTLLPSATAESTATPIPTQTLVPTEAPTQTATPEPVPFSIEQDAPFPEELGTPVIAVRWGEEGSFTISTKDTPYTLVSTPGERPIFDTPEGKEFFFGLLAKAFGYENANDYLEAVSNGEAKTITLPQFGIQEGPVTIDPAKVSIVFEATEVNDPDKVWFEGKLEDHARKTGGWIRNVPAQVSEQRSYIKLESLEDGRVMIRIRSISPHDGFVGIGDAYYSYEISDGAYMLARMLTNNGKFPPEGFGMGVNGGWIDFSPIFTVKDDDTIVLFSSFDSNGKPQYETFYETTFWELLGIEQLYTNPYTKYSGPSDFVRQ